MTERSKRALRDLFVNAQNWAVVVCYGQNGFLAIPSCNIHATPSMAVSSGDKNRRKVLCAEKNRLKYTVKRRCKYVFFLFELNFI